MFNKNIIKKIYFYLPEYFSKPIKLKTKFIFIVGCGHSGTTLVATLIGRSNEMLLLPEETGVFKRPIFTAREIVKQWDIITRYFNKKYCVEKTPKHIRMIEKIFKVIPESRVVIMTRNPVDNIASLKERSKSFNTSLKRWIEDNKAGTKWLEDPRVLVIKYELLIEDRQEFLNQINKHLGTNLKLEIFDESSSQWSEEHSLAGKTELLVKRINQVTKPIYDTRGSGKLILSSEELQIIKNKTEKLNRELGY